jgi:predicted nucleotidyltransferase
MFEKPPTTISEKPKRFPLQKEEFARRKTCALQKTIELVKEEYPEIIGATLFGSLAQGRAHENSDIDTYIFIDTERIPSKYIPNNQQVLHKNYLVRPTSFIHGKLEMGTSMQSNLHHSYEDYIRNVLAGNAHMHRYIGIEERDAFKDTIVMPVSIQSIKQLVKELALPKLIQPKQSVGSFSGVETKRRDNKYPKWLDTIVPMFHLAIGNDIRQYRCTFLEELLKHGEKGEKIWQEVRTQLIMRERGKKGKERPEGTHYPETITDALQAFG